MNIFEYELVQSIETKKKESWKEILRDSTMSLCHYIDESCRFPLDVSYEVSEEDLSRRSGGLHRHGRPPNVRSTSLTRPQLGIPATLTRSYSVSRSALVDASGRSPCRRPVSSNSFRAVGAVHARRFPVARIPSPEDEFDYISTRIGRRNPLLAKVSTSANASLRRKKHPLLGKIGQAKSTSGGRNWMQLKQMFSVTRHSEDEPVELVRVVVFTKFVSIKGPANNLLFACIVN